MIEIIAFFFLFILIVGVIGGIIWIFVEEDRQTKDYIKFLCELDKLNEEEDYNG